MKKPRPWIFYALAVVLAGPAWLAFRFNPAAARSATGFVSHSLCSGVFVSGLAAGRVYADSLKSLKEIADMVPVLGYEVDTGRREVKARLFGRFESVAVFRDGLGCLVLRGDPPPASPAPASPATRQAPALPEIAGASLVEPAAPGLRAALDHAFEESRKDALRRTAAVVVVQDGRIVAERYAAGYGIATPLLGWSATKSVVNALIGLLAHQGKLSIDAPAPVSQWRQPNDPHQAVTIDHLLRMTSGLDVSETNKDFDAVSQMLFNERDTAAFAERAGLKAAPGTQWEYTSGNTIVLSRIIRDAVGGNAAGVRAFAQRELFEPLGMRNVTLEFDATGTPLGSTYLFASARDWARFAMLYLDDGVIGGRRLLPEGWVRYSSTRTLDSPYAAGFWLGSAAWRKRWGIPGDAFFASGFLGQRIMVIPSERMVVARFGNASGPGFDAEGFGRLVSDVRETLGLRKQ